MRDRPVAVRHNIVDAMSIRHEKDKTHIAVGALVFARKTLIANVCCQEFQRSENLILHLNGILFLLVAKKKT